LFSAFTRSPEKKRNPLDIFPLGSGLNNQQIRGVRLIANSVLREFLAAEPFIDFLSVPDSFNHNVLFLIDEIDDSVGTDSKRKFAFKIPEELFPGEWI